MDHPALVRYVARCRALFTSICIASLISPTLHAQEAADEEVDAFPAFTFLRGANIPVRGAAETEFSEQTSVVPVEVYRDEDFGAVVMLTESGSIGVLKQPPVFEVKLLGVDEDLVAVRFMPRSGATWVMEDMQWVGVSETDAAQLFLGDYDVQMVETDGVVWYVRSDALTGRTWILAREDADDPPIWMYAADPDLDSAEVATDN